MTASSETPRSAADEAPASSAELRASARVPRVLVIDDDPAARLIIGRLLSDQKLEVLTAEAGLPGLQLALEKHPDVVVLDNVLPDISGLEVLRRLRTFDAQLPVVFITAQGTSHTAIEAMKSCAFDFLPKPLDLHRLQEQITRAIEARRLMRVPVVIDAAHDTDEPGDLLVGRSPLMQEVYKSIGRVALQEVPVLLEGETGTGKELVARAIYQHGGRSQGPFLVVKCSDFNSVWLESELFGHEEAAFPGALAERVGKFEQCAGGVLLLEEVGDLALSTQSKLLRALRDGRFERVGSADSRTLDVRVIATTSADLEPSVHQGQFRADLYYFLHGFRVRLPAVRERPEDIPALVDHFVRRVSRITRALGSDVVRVSADAMALLSQYAWPGNLDELQSVLKRALIETKGTVVASDFLRATLRNPHDAAESLAATGGIVTNWHAFVDTRVARGAVDVYAAALGEMDRQLLGRVLESTGGNQARAAKILGITRGSLRKKIRTLGLALPQAALRSVVDDEDADNDTDDSAPTDDS